MSLDLHLVLARGSFTNDYTQIEKILDYVAQYFPSVGIRLQSLEGDESTNAVVDLIHKKGLDVVIVERYYVHDYLDLGNKNVLIVQQKGGQQVHRLSERVNRDRRQFDFGGRYKSMPTGDILLRQYSVNSWGDGGIFFLSDTVDNFLDHSADYHQPHETLVIGRIRMQNGLFIPCFALKDYKLEQLSRVKVLGDCL